MKDLKLLTTRSGVRIPPGPLHLDFSSQSSQLSTDPEWDIYNTKRRYLKTLKSIEDWDITLKNKIRIFDFLRRTKIKGIGIVQRQKYLYAFKSLFRAVNKDFDDLTENDLEDFLLSMGHYKTKTIKTRWYSLTKFFKFLGKEDLIKNIKPTFKIRGTVLPEELLTEEEIKTMIEASYNIRDKALISTLFDSGTRIGELLSRKLKHVVFDKYGGVLVVDGKTGMRRIRLISCIPLLANWISNHPKRNDPESFLWINLNNYKAPIKYRAVLKMLKDKAKRCGIRKNVHPHLFRHSRATNLAKHLTEQELKVYFGWVGGSQMASVYVHLSGKDIENKILEINGIKKQEKDAENLKPQVCIRCGNMNDISSKYCNKCGMLLDIKEAFNVGDVVSDNEFYSFLMDMFEKWKKKH